jgi:hypothetical protein
MVAAVSTLLAASASALVAQVLPGQVYRGGDVVSDPQSGLRLTMPDGWSGQLSRDGEFFVMVPDSGEGTIVVVADELTDAAARRQLGEVIDLGGGVKLRPGGQVHEVATGHYSADFEVEGSDSPRVATVDVRIANSGLGVAFVLLSPPSTADSLRGDMRELAFSLGVIDSKVTPATATAGGGDAWEPYLRGRYLARYFTRTGYTESTELWLCSDGTFAYRSQGGGFGGGASGAAQASGSGAWSATGAGKSGTLILTWSSGGSTTLELGYDYEQDRMYLNGERVLRGTNERCR